MEIFCKFLNEEFKKNEPRFGNLEELKKSVPLPSPAKDHFIEIQPGEDFVRMIYRQNALNDPIFLKFEGVDALLTIGSMKAASVETFEFVGISNAIQRLADSEARRSAVDSAFDHLLDDYIKELSSRNTDYSKRLAEIRQLSVLKKMDQYFLKNSTLNEEYEKIKKATIDQLKISKA